MMIKFDLNPSRMVRQLSVYAALFIAVIAFADLRPIFAQDAKGDTTLQTRFVENEMWIGDFDEMVAGSDLDAVCLPCRRTSTAARWSGPQPSST